MPDRPLYPVELLDELLELACHLRAQRHRREHPNASEKEIEAVVNAWLDARPGAPEGDTVGRLVAWPRSR